MIEPSNKSQVDNFPDGLAAPARRALAAAGVSRLEQLSGFTEAEVLKWHGIGPNAMAKLRKAMQEHSIEFMNGKAP